MKNYDEQIKLLGATSVNNLMELARVSELEKLYAKVKDWWSTVYPEDIFTGESGDEGAVKVKEVWDIINNIREHEERILEYRRYMGYY
jgi:hypothetical protein